MIKKILDIFNKKTKETNKKGETVIIYEKKEKNDEIETIVEINKEKIEVEIEQALKLKNIARINKEIDEEEIKERKIARIEKFLEAQTNAIAHKVSEAMIQPLIKIIETNTKITTELEETKKEIKELKEITTRIYKIVENKTTETTEEKPTTENQNQEEVKQNYEEYQEEYQIEYYDEPEKKEITTTEETPITKENKTKVNKKKVKKESKISNVLNKELEKITGIKKQTLKETIKELIENIKNREINLNKDKVIIANLFELTEIEKEEIKEDELVAEDYKKNSNKILEEISKYIDKIEETPSVKVNRYIDKSINKKEIIKLSYVNLLEHVASLIITAYKILEITEGKPIQEIEEIKKELIIIGSFIHDAEKIDEKIPETILNQIEDKTLTDKIIKTFIKEIIEHHDTIKKDEKTTTKIIKIADKISRIIELRLLESKPNEDIETIINQESKKFLTINKINQLIEKLKKSQNPTQDIVKTFAEKSIVKAIIAALEIYNKNTKETEIKEKKNKVIESLEKIKPKERKKEKKNEESNNNINNDYYVDYI